MSEPAGQLLEQRVLVLAPNDKDAALTARLLAEARLPGFLCSGLPALEEELERGAGAAILTEQALASGKLPGLLTVLARQPAWSEFPFVVLTTGGADSTVGMHALEVLGNVVLLDQPVRVTTLLSALRMALRSRERQYQVRELLRVREEKQAALHEADRRKDEFLAMLAHELRNPLAPLSNTLELLKRTYPDPARLERMREMMARQVGQLGHLVDDLLEVSRITQGKIHLRPEPVELSQVVTRTVETVRALIQSQGHELTVELPAEPVWLEVDPVRLEQVLGNLLNNAAKFTEPGGRLWLQAAVSGGEVAIRVKDTGVGIAPELLPDIFDLFTQADRSLDRSQGGLGIGLSLVKNLVELHHGRVEAFSEGAGQGSEFVVYLPVLAAPGASPRPALPRGVRAQSHSPRRVLVVDDNRDSAETMAAILEEWQHEVRCAHDGPSAVTVARAYRPEVVFLDIGLPGMDGYEVARALRREPELTRTIVVAMTGYGQEEDFCRSREAGFDEHLVKPVDPRALERVLADDYSPTDRQSNRQ